MFENLTHFIVIILVFRAKKNQEISVIQRQIDDIPTRAELLQFERRFVELNDMIADKLIETRKYYNMYNTLDDSHGYMRQECDLLNSIIEGFPVAARAKNTQTQFKTQVAGILDGLDKTKAHVNGQYESEATSRDVLVYIILSYIIYIYIYITDFF